MKVPTVEEITRMSQAQRETMVDAAESWDDTSRHVLMHNLRICADRSRAEGERCREEIRVCHEIGAVVDRLSGGNLDIPLKDVLPTLRAAAIEIAKASSIRNPEAWLRAEFAWLFDPNAPLLVPLKDKP